MQSFIYALLLSALWSSWNGALQICVYVINSCQFLCMTIFSFSSKCRFSALFLISAENSCPYSRTSEQRMPQWNHTCYFLIQHHLKMWPKFTEDFDQNLLPTNAKNKTDSFRNFWHLFYGESSLYKNLNTAQMSVCNKNVHSFDFEDLILPMAGWLQLIAERLNCDRKTSRLTHFWIKRETFWRKKNI